MSKSGRRTNRVQRFANSIGRSPCTKKLGSGLNTAYKVCKRNDCTQCSVVKIGQYIEQQEIYFIKKLEKLTKGTQYANMVTHFQKLVMVDNQMALVTKYTENLGDMVSYFDKYTVTVPIMQSIIFQLFSLLNFLYEKGNFLHMDLKPDNILIEPPPSQPTVVLIDYGLSYDGQNYGSVMESKPFNGEVFHPAFDIFRFFDCMRDLRCSPAVRAYLETLTNKVMGPIEQYHKKDMYLKTYSMLTPKGLQYLLSKHPNLDFAMVIARA